MHIWRSSPSPRVLLISKTIGRPKEKGRFNANNNSRKPEKKRGGLLSLLKLFLTDDSNDGSSTRRWPVECNSRIQRRPHPILLVICVLTSLDLSTWMDGIWRYLRASKRLWNNPSIGSEISRSAAIHTYEAFCTNVRKTKKLKWAIDAPAALSSMGNNNDNGRHWRFGTFLLFLDRPTESTVLKMMLIVNEHLRDERTYIECSHSGLGGSGPEKCFIHARDSLSYENVTKTINHMGALMAFLWTSSRALSRFRFLIGLARVGLIGGWALRWLRDWITRGIHLEKICGEPNELIMPGLTHKNMIMAGLWKTRN